MKAKKQDINIRELFRQKLESSEVTPDASVRSKLLRRLARKEFLRFSPARFNIYYLGGILVAGITAAVILFSGTGESDHVTPLIPSGEINITDTTGYIKLPMEQPMIQKSDRLNGSASGSAKNKMINRLKAESEKVPVQNSESRESNIVAPAGGFESILKKMFLTGTSADKNKLKGGLRYDEVLFKSSATEGCTPLKVQFSNKSITYDSCRWTFGDGGYSSEKNPVWIFDVEGEYNVILQLFDSKGLRGMSSTGITVYPKPKARFEFAPEKAVLPEDEIRFHNYSTNSVHFRWDFGDGSVSDLYEPRHRYSKFGNYNVRLVVTSDHGCADSLIVMNAFSGSGYFIDFPNAFIPNPQGATGGYYSPKSDEAALVFHPVSSGVSDFQLKIFSKLGILIFESNDINIGWDGYFKGQLCDPGVYIWKVRGNFRNGEPFTKMGDVTILRN